jgi:four helix bundle protein
VRNNTKALRQALIFEGSTRRMDKYELQRRTKQFHVDVIRLCADFPKNAAGYETAKQLIRAAGSVGSNYRAACRAKSTADFIYKIEVVLEETDESLYWLEVIKLSSLNNSPLLDSLINEATELVKIFNKTDMTAKQNNQHQNKSKSLKSAVTKTGFPKNTIND